MRILTVADTHYGARSNNPHLYEYQKKFIDDVLIPTLDTVKPDLFVHLGDLVDDRKSITQLTYTRCRDDFIDPVVDLCEKNRTEIHWIVGNHDSYYKNTLKINAVNDIFALQACEEVFQSDELLFVPWICQDNREEILNTIKQSNAKYCFGHFELIGFKQNEGRISNAGDDAGILDKFELVLTGHFHTKSKQGNVLYTGSAFEFNWGDYDDYRGITILDTETRKISFKKNPHRLFKMAIYDDAAPHELPEPQSFKNTYARLIVLRSGSDVRLNDYVSQINDVGVIDLQVFREEVNLNDYKEKKNVNIKVDDTKEIFLNHINSLDIPDKDGLQSEFNDVYSEAEKL